MTTISRIKTGVVQFENDWPGIFLRGDDAIGYAASLEIVASEIDAAKVTARAHVGLTRLAEIILLLESCRVEKKPEVQRITRQSERRPSRYQAI